MSKHPCPHPGCTAVFPRPYRLAAHLLSHENKKGYKCKHDDCGREYTNNSHLLRHYKTAHKSPDDDTTFNFSCPHCWRVYSNRQNLKRHIKIYHVATNLPYVCDYCNKDFVKKHQLTAHMYIHTSVKGFCCEYCSKLFVLLHDKKKHMRQHLKHQCDECKEQFLFWSKYVEHRRNFHSTKEFTCHHCARHFYTRVHIVHHMKIHRDEQREVFQCSVPKCMKFYTTLSNLKQHIMSVHERKTFDCTTCVAKLSTKANLKKHMESHKSPIKIKIKREPKKRKERKDKGVPRQSMALKIAGMPLEFETVILDTVDNVVIEYDTPPTLEV